MPSPFPGMDPYLEQHWRDVHHRLVTYSCDALQLRLPDELVARMEERVYVEREPRQTRVVYPDVYVARQRPTRQVAPLTSSDVAIIEPILVPLADEPVTEGYIEIRDSSGNQLVTVVEFLSPSNKVPGEGQMQYERKQWEVIQARVSLVEIDLTRTGKRRLAVPEDRVPPELRATYCASVRRAWRPDEGEYYPLPLRERLPGIRIPLRQDDSDVPLDLQALVDQCYRNGRYESLDYRADPAPPLVESDAEWADQLLRSKGLR